MRLYFSLESANERTNWILNSILDEKTLSIDTMPLVKRIEFYLNEAFDHGVSSGINRVGIIKPSEWKAFLKYLKGIK